MSYRLSNLLVPVTAWVMAAVLAFKIAALVQIAWAEEKPAATASAEASPAAQPAPGLAASTAPAASSAPASEKGSVRPADSMVAAATPPTIEPIRAPAAPALPPDWKLLQDLRSRRDALDKRSAALDARQTALDAAQHAVEQRLQEIERRQTELASLETDRKTQEQAGMQGLVKLYEDMKPAEAAAIFDALDLHVLLPILDKMNERKAAAIMGDMQPERARFATQALARYRSENALGPSAAPPTPG